MKENIAVIVQARLGSSRLPGKILLPLNGYPVLEHVLERCAAILGRDQVICVGVDSPSEAPVRALVERLGIEFIAGDEQDVLSRYYLAAKARNVDWVVRVTSDCPLLDPVVCRGLIDKVIAEDADFGITEGWPHGLDCEIINFPLLEKSYREAIKKEEREHVTLWSKRQPDIKQIGYRPLHPVQHLDRYRWVLDYPEDYRFLQVLFTAMDFTPTTPAGYQKVIEYLAGHSDLMEINHARIKEWGEAQQQLLSQ